MWLILIVYNNIYIMYILMWYIIRIIDMTTMILFLRPFYTVSNKDYLNLHTIHIKTKDSFRALQCD
jgi:hypothetical protein